MFLAVRLRAREQFGWHNDYGYGVMGRVGEALQGTTYDRSHANGSPPPYTFSEIRPFSHEVKEGHDKYLVFASPESELIRLVAEDFQSNPRLNVGPMRYSIRAAAIAEPTVGEPGDSGWLQSLSGLNIAINPDDDGPDEYWGTKDSESGRAQDFDAFREALHRSVRGACRGQYIPVSDEDADLFDGYELIKTFAAPFTVTSGEQITAVRSHWRLQYEIRDEEHRQQLDVLHKTGVGKKTGYGCGMLAPVPTPEFEPGDAVLYIAEQALVEEIELGGDRPQPEVVL